MAYLDPDALFAAAAGRAVPLEEPVASAFTPLEWSVIALARNESLRSLDQPGRLSRAIGSLFGMGVASSLADPRLEALRRLAVYAWHRGFALPLREIERFLGSGFVEAQSEALVISVTGMRVGGDRRGARA